MAEHKKIYEAVVGAKRSTNTTLQAMDLGHWKPASSIENSYASPTLSSRAAALCDTPTANV